MMVQKKINLEMTDKDAEKICVDYVKEQVNK